MCANTSHFQPKMSTKALRFRIGYAFSPKKVSSLMQPSLLSVASTRGLDFIQIDTKKPLTDQGPFDCVIHKVYDEDWKNKLKDFALKNPRVCVVDSLAEIERIHDRISMLEVVDAVEVQQQDVRFGVPKQIVVSDLETLSNLDMRNVKDGPSTDVDELKFPVIAKPLAVDGSAKSHKLSLVFNNDGLKALQPPIVLQEFVNHGGVIFKVYVIGKYVKCVTRSSLPDITEDMVKTSEGILSFSQISKLAGQDGSDETERVVEETEMPPMSFVNDLANGLRKALSLNLFNFDVIRDSRDWNRYFVIDINYFPGYYQMTSYESVLTNFLLDIVQQKQNETGKLDTEEMEK